MIKNLKGKNVMPLSQYPGEREILLPPGQIQWLYTKDVNVRDKTGKINKVALFIAKPVTVPKEKPTLQNE